MLTIQMFIQQAEDSAEKQAQHGLTEVKIVSTVNGPRTDFYHDGERIKREEAEQYFDMPDPYAN